MKNDTKIVSSDTLAMMIQKKANKDSITKKTKKTITDEIKRLIQTESEENSKMLCSSWLSLDKIKSYKVKQELMMCFPDNMIKVDNGHPTIESRKSNHEVNEPIALSGEDNQKSNSSNGIEKGKPINLNDNYLDSSSIDGELQLRISLNCDSSIKNLKESLIFYLVGKEITECKIKKITKLIDKLNKKQDLIVIKKRIAEALGITSLNDSNSEEIMNIFIDKLNDKISNVEFKNKATSTTDLTEFHINNVLNYNKLMDDFKPEIPIELKADIDSAIEKNDFHRVKSLLNKIKRNKVSDIYSSVRSYLRYGKIFPNGSDDDEKIGKIEKIIHEIENPSVKHRILNFFMDMKFKILKLYNKLF
ncbi:MULTISPECIES: hypothetical protein [unclassified Providencia]|nr:MULTISPECIES: hypothetical protein [unclassified Providencia]